MKLKLRRKNKLAVKKVTASECFNCGHPFFGQEKFCPECGQKNKNPKITFGSFVHEVFNGFISWDSKFWTTFIPLLTKPGKVSRDYIDGKRIRYANPFRFYLTISVIFFLIIGLTESYDRFNEFRRGKTKTTTISSALEGTTKKIDSTTAEIKTNLNSALKDLDSTERAEVIKSIPIITNDSVLKNTSSKNSFEISGITNWNKFNNFYADHKDLEIDDALDSLNVEKTFYNRFVYSRVQVVHDISKDNNKLQDIKKQFISYISLSLFIFLPILTLFLKFFYVRRKYTYVEHLVFVFHTQTVFFLLSTLFYIINYMRETDYIIGIFLLLFLIYLFLAMKRFYNQGLFKTFFKFILINVVFSFISMFGVFIIGILTFMMY